jgi:phospholipid/cholesterol/gamma-HCH transport system ATP-binding protein
LFSENSGTGKSTTLKLIVGLELPSSGTIRIRDWTRRRTIQDEFGVTKIAMVFQRAALFDSLTVGENVAFQLIQHSGLPRARIDELAMRALGRVGLSHDIMNLYPSQLSGGMQKRVSFARSILFDPDDLDGLCRAPEILLLVSDRMHLNFSWVRLMADLLTIFLL